MFDPSTLNPRLLRKQHRHILALRQKAGTPQGRELLDGVIAILEALMREIDPQPGPSITLKVRR